jgi:hypothetical protein
MLWLCAPQTRPHKIRIFTFQNPEIRLINFFI